MATWFWPTQARQVIFASVMVTWEMRLSLTVLSTSISLGWKSEILGDGIVVGRVEKVEGVIDGDQELGRRGGDE